VEAGEDCDDGNASGGDGCSGACQWEITCTAAETIACGASDWGDALGVSNSASNYSAQCGGAGYSYDDRIYSFVPASSGLVTVSLWISDWDDDFDLFILEGACNPALCIDYGDNIGDDSVTFNATAGVTYYAVVEFYDWWSIWGDYQLQVSCP